MVVFACLKMLHRNGSLFDEAAALEELVSKYGTEEPDVKTESPTKKKRKPEGGEKGGEDDVASPSSAAKKPKKTDIVTVEGNRAAAEAIKEMADIYFKNKDNRKGGEHHLVDLMCCNLMAIALSGVFSKGAKAIREADFLITDKKAAMKLPGVGKGIAGYIEELKESGSIRQLEELRAGTA